MFRAQFRQIFLFGLLSGLLCVPSRDAGSLEKAGSAQKSAKVQAAADALKSAAPETHRLFCPHPSSKKKLGWILEIASKDMGTCRYSVIEDGFKVETPMCLMFGNFRTGMAAVANLETQKYFVFPLTKTKYYLSLMGVSIYSRHESKFDKEFRQSDWKKTRDVKFEDLPGSEFERHVLNPPRGRTRTHYQLLTHLPGVPNRIYEFYHDIMQTEPAMPNSIVIDDRVEITNPTARWKELTVKKAQRALFSEAELCVPNTLRAVDTVADVTIDDTVGGESRESLKSLQRDAPNQIYKSRPK